MKNKDLNSPEEIEQKLKLGEHVKKGARQGYQQLNLEIETLYYLKKYRRLRKTYNETKD